MIQLQAIGNLTQGAVMNNSATGGNVISFTVAVNQGDGATATCTYIRCSQYISGASKLLGYLCKGTKVFVSGNLSVREWTDNANNIHEDLRLNVKNIELLGQPKMLTDNPTLAETGQNGTTTPQTRQGGKTTPPKTKQAQNTLNFNGYEQPQALSPKTPDGFVDEPIPF